MNLIRISATNQFRSSELFQLLTLFFVEFRTTPPPSRCIKIGETRNGNMAEEDETPNWFSIPVFCCRTRCEFSFPNTNGRQFSFVSSRGTFYCADHSSSNNRRKENSKNTLICSRACGRLYRRLYTEKPELLYIKTGSALSFLLSFFLCCWPSKYPTFDQSCFSRFTALQKSC